ncbi:YqaJ viral recombinase family protein [Uliginosibacterium sp. 31-12]|uniref:YqaJ viral recombinase family protein n=1 Tax=Uliginosibacterium sp. 31-12 TaxID=3062781 RepID=UPI0026E13A18|nr:YqaJ viral recombinase family protein [Uliginosibacterium sp. 31-12]MDO6385621.1 YqaJ viral recombinase family protein [Uliginosibacterium sp. 31-12]
MDVINTKQGSSDWINIRLRHFCASEAPAALGLSKYQTRTDLLAMKKSGIAEDVAPATQALFDRGHAAEANARPIAERFIGEELYPCTGRAEVEGLPLLASFDGLTMAEDVAFEHKLYAGWLADYLSEHDDLPDTHWPQVEHQFIVSGATCCLFMCSDGTENNCAHIWYESKPERRAAVLAGWHQFAADLAAYEPQAQPAPVAAAPVEGLPSVFVQVTGSLAITDNLQKFGEALRSFLDRTPTKPATDEEFAVCESAIKTLTKAEEALDAAEAAALAQVSCVDEMRMLKATLRDLARSNRLALEKLVKAEKENRKQAIVQKGQKDLAAFVAALPCAEYMPTITGDFGGAIKGLGKGRDPMASIQNAVDTELARAKIDATGQSQKIAANMAAIEAHPEHAALFADRRTLALKDAEFVALTVKQRIADHQAAEAAKIERIRAEEQAKAEKEARDKLAQEQIENAKAEIQAKPDLPKLSAETMAALVGPSNITPAAPNIPAAAPNIEPVAKRGAPTLSLGKIATRLGFAVSRDFLHQLGFEGTKDRAAYLYHEADFRAICNAIAAYVLAKADYVEQEAA